MDLPEGYSITLDTFCQVRLAYVDKIFPVSKLANFQGLIRPQHFVPERSF